MYRSISNYFCWKVQSKLFRGRFNARFVFINSFPSSLCIPFLIEFTFILFYSRHFDKVMRSFAWLRLSYKHFFLSLTLWPTSVLRQRFSSCCKGIFYQLLSTVLFWRPWLSIIWNFTSQNWFFRLFYPPKTCLLWALWPYPWKLSKSFSRHQDDFQPFILKFLWKLGLQPLFLYIRAKHICRHIIDLA